MDASAGAKLLAFVMSGPSPARPGGAKKLLGGTEPKGGGAGAARALGGKAKRGGGGPPLGQHPNNRDVLTVQPLQGKHAGPAPVLVPTTDPFDRAHQIPSGLDGVQPACRVLDRRGGKFIVGLPLEGSRPRQYPRSQMVTGPQGPVSIDSQFDAAYETARWLAENVGDVAGAGSYLSGGVQGAVNREKAVELARTAYAAKGVRASLHRMLRPQRSKY